MSQNISITAQQIIDHPIKPIATQNSNGRSIYGETTDLNEMLVTNKSFTYSMQVNSQAMKDAGINKGDMVLVDRSLTVTNGKIVIALVGNEMFIRRLEMGNGKIFLVPANSTLASMDVTQIPFEVWGVVTYVVHSL